MSAQFLRDVSPESGEVGRSQAILDEQDTFANRVARRWWVATLTVVLAIGFAFAFLATATPVYRATVILTTGHGETVVGSIPPRGFLAAQPEVIRSPAVLAAATRAAPGLSDPAAALHVSTSTDDGTITIGFDAADPQQAATAANAIADAYLLARGDVEGSSMKGLTDLAARRDARAAERGSAEKALADYRAAVATAGTEAERAAAARYEQLNAALFAAQLEAADATAAAEAARSRAVDPQKLAAAIEASRPTGIFAELDQQRNRLADELRAAEAQLERQRQTMLAQHPSVLATQRRIAELKAARDATDKRYGDVYLAHVERQQEAVARKVADLRQIVDAQQDRAAEHSARAARVAALEGSLNRADAALADADKALRSAMLDADTGGPDVRIAQPAQPARRPIRPDRTRVLLIALVAGAAAGIVIVTLGSAIR